MCVAQCVSDSLIDCCSLEYRRLQGEYLYFSAHSLGCFHEHSRHDRDQYVTVKWENIIEGEFRTTVVYTF